MKIYRSKYQYTAKPVHSSEITSEHLYVSRRQFLKSAGILSIGALATAACGSGITQVPAELPVKLDTNSSADELGDPLNSYQQITHYNNYYEFSLDKENVGPLSTDFPTSPWEVKVTGLVNNPKTYTVDDLQKFPQEERIYRLRCVEGWSMVIPWNGFPLARILSEVEPLSTAKYVRFVTVLNPDEMPGQQDSSFPWPYQEGLRIDEAMHNLTILATGLYGNPLTPQNGAPVRLVVPWKYGFKSSKSIVQIDLMNEQPKTLWSTVAPHEYGFFANVNPNVPHPRWPQSSERRIGESGRRDTLIFNGYAEEVARLYDGMDLRVNY